MKKLLLSVVLIGVTSILSIGATSAYFSDTEISSGNTFTAGTLDLKLDNGDINVVKFTYTNLRPGNQPKRTYVLKNAGTLPGTIKLSNIVIEDTENGCLEPEVDAGDVTCAPSQGELSQALSIRIWVDTNKNGWISTGETVLYSGPVADLPSSIDLNKTLAPVEEANIVFLLDWWNNHYLDDDMAQGDGFSMSVNFDLEQIH